MRRVLRSSQRVLSLLFWQPAIVIPRKLWRRVWRRPLLWRTKLELLILPWVLVLAVLAVDVLASFASTHTDDLRLLLGESEAALVSQILLDVRTFLGAIAGLLSTAVAAPLEVAAAAPAFLGWPLVLVYAWVLILLSSSLFFGPIHVGLDLYLHSRSPGETGPPFARATHRRRRAPRAGEWLVGTLPSHGEMAVPLDRKENDHVWIVGGGSANRAATLTLAQADIAAGRAVLFVDTSSDSGRAAALFASAREANRGASFDHLGLEALPRVGVAQASVGLLRRALLHARVAYLGLPPQLPAAATEELGRVLLAEARAVAADLARGRFMDSERHGTLLLDDVSRLCLSDLPRTLRDAADSGLSLVASQRFLQGASADAAWLASMREAAHIRLCLAPQGPAQTQRVARVLSRRPTSRLGRFDLSVDLLQSLEPCEAILAQGTSAQRLSLACASEPAGIGAIAPLGSLDDRCV